MYVAWERCQSRLNSHVEAVTGSTKSRSCSMNRAGTTSEAFYRPEWLLGRKGNGQMLISISHPRDYPESYLRVIGDARLRLLLIQHESCAGEALLRASATVRRGSRGRLRSVRGGLRILLPNASTTHPCTFFAHPHT